MHPCRAVKFNAWLSNTLWGVERTVHVQSVCRVSLSMQCEQNATWGPPFPFSGSGVLCYWIETAAAPNYKSIWICRTQCYRKLNIHMAWLDNPDALYWMICKAPKFSHCSVLESIKRVMGPLPQFTQWLLHCLSINRKGLRGRDNIAHVCDLHL